MDIWWFRGIDKNEIEDFDLAEGRVSRNVHKMYAEI